MSRYAYEVSKKLALDDVPFDALIMAAMRRADTYNALSLRARWPELWDELEQRYHAPGGILPGEEPAT